jgi:predicted transcriptional regulator
MRFTRITITRVDYKPVNRPDINEELQQLGGALGLINLRDKDKSRFRIFIAMLKALKRRELMSSDDLADQLGLTRATVIHHLDALMDAGIVEHMRGKYQLRVETLEELVEVIEADITRTLDELKEVARNCDKGLGLDQPRKPARNVTPY